MRIFGYSDAGAGAVVSGGMLDEMDWSGNYQQYSKEYVAEEEAARTKRRGLHMGTFVPPWDWRRGKRLP